MFVGCNMNTIAFKEIDAFLVDVNEAIVPTYLNEFVFFKLDENGIDTDVSSTVFVRYLNPCNKYFIAHFKPTQEDFFLQPQMLEAYFSSSANKNTSTILFVLNNYFALYFEKELLFFKEIKQKVSSWEIMNFLEKTLCLKIDTCVELSQKEEMSLQEEFKNNLHNLKKLPLIKNNQLSEIKKFLSFIFLILGLVIAVFVYEYHTKTSLKIEQKERVFYPKKELLSYKLALFIEQINKETLTLISMDLNNDWLIVSLQHKDKFRLIEFLSLYKGEIKTLQYDEKKSVYELSTSFKFL